MGILASKPAGDAAAAARAAAALNRLSVVGVGMTIRGDVETAGVVKIEGTVEGHVIGGMQVLVAKGGVVKGDIETKEAIIGGTVSGAVQGGERVEIQAGATVQGDITTKRIAVAEGASMNGQVRMGESLDRVVVKGKAAAPASVASMTRPSVPVARVAVSPRSGQ